MAKKDRKPGIQKEKKEARRESQERKEGGAVFFPCRSFPTDVIPLRFADGEEER